MMISRGSKGKLIRDIDQRLKRKNIYEGRDIYFVIKGPFNNGLYALYKQTVPSMDVHVYSRIWRNEK